MRPGEIYLAHFPFGDVPGMKLRPVLLLTGERRVGSRSAGGLHFIGPPRATVAFRSHRRSR